MDISAVKSFILYRAREHASKNGKASLLNEKTFFGIIVIAINELLDLNKEAHTDSQKKLFEKTIAHIKDHIRTSFREEKPTIYTDSLADNMSYIMVKFPTLLEDINYDIKFLYENFSVQKYDSDFIPEKHKEILQNTINIFKQEFEILKDLEEYDEYEKYLQNNIEKHSGKKTTTGKSKYENLSIDFIIESLERKVNNEKELNAILNSMQNLEVNFYITRDDLTIYPIILDLLIDTASIDFQFYLDREIIQKNIEVWKQAKKAHLDRGFYTQNTFHRIDLIEQVNYKRSRPYLLHEYIKGLHKEDSKVQKLFQTILYNTSENSKGSPSFPSEKFNDIKPRRFLLENTKMVLGKP
jgi:hypothetical protein